jgi:DNA-binding NtrC family response regulator
MLLDYRGRKHRELKNLFERTVLLENGGARAPAPKRAARAAADAEARSASASTIVRTRSSDGIRSKRWSRSWSALILRASYATKWNQSRTAELLSSSATSCATG